MTSRHDASEIERFVQQWLVRHLPAGPAPANLALEVDRLAAQLTGDARASGITGGELHRAIGDLDDYLAARCQAPAA